MLYFPEKFHSNFSGKYLRYAVLVIRFTYSIATKDSNQMQLSA